MALSHVYQEFKNSTGVTTDTRVDLKGKIYFALKGPNFNGNTFANKALEQGAKAVVVDEKEYANHPKAFLVSDVLKFLQDLATHHRLQVNPTVIGLTGSNGKTTTKELLYSVLKQSYKVQCTQGNLNNHIGVPLTLLSCQPETEILIVEMGANHPGEIQHLSNIALPNHGLITNIGKAHLEGFGSIEGVDTSKRELFDFIKRNAKGYCFINNSDPFLSKAAELYTHKIYFGTNSHYAIERISYQSGDQPYLAVQIKLDKDVVDIQSNLVGDYNAQNILASACLGSFLGVNPSEIKTGIENYVPNNSRSQLSQGKRNKLILDAYNANPSSVELAIKTLSNFQGEKLAILGEMKEGGENSYQEHKSITELLEQLELPHFLVGQEYKSLPTQHTLGYYDTWKDLLQGEKDLQAIEGKTVLLKGSRSVGLENLAPYL